MDSATLVEEMKEDGRLLLARLAEEGFPVAGACWLRGADDGYWFLYLATPLVSDNGGTKAAYGRMLDVIDGMPQPLWLDPQDIKVVRVNSPIGKAIAELYDKYPNSTRAIPFRGTRFGDLHIEDSYIYPPVAAPVR